MRIFRGRVLFVSCLTVALGAWAGGTLSSSLDENPRQERPKPDARTSATQPQTRSGTDSQKQSESQPNEGRSVRLPDVVVRIDRPSDEKDESPVSKWIRWSLERIISWPFLMGFVLLYFLFADAAPLRLQKLVGLFDSLKLFGQEFVISRKGGENAEVGISFFRTEIETALDQEVGQYELKKKHEKLLDEIILKKLSGRNLQVRSTIYVLDRLFDETLYQLLDYYPSQTVPGRGRTYSERYGIIGKAWRLKKTQYDPTVPTDESRLILEWGMTADEAKLAAHGRQSFGCMCLKDSTETLLALLYLDSPQENAFGSDPEWKEIERAVQGQADTSNLIAGLKKINSKSLSMGPRIHIRKS